MMASDVCVCVLVCKEMKQEQNGENTNNKHFSICCFVLLFLSSFTWDGMVSPSASGSVFWKEEEEGDDEKHTTNHLILWDKIHPDA